MGRTRRWGELQSTRHEPGSDSRKLNRTPPITRRPNAGKPTASSYCSSSRFSTRSVGSMRSVRRQDAATPTVV